MNSKTLYNQPMQKHSMPDEEPDLKDDFTQSFLKQQSHNIYRIVTNCAKLGTN